MTGCYSPCHSCIDNWIHTCAGVELRNECALIIKNQGHEEQTGSAKITSGYNLLAKHVIHTVGPIVQGSLTKQNEDDLASCYRSCLELAVKNGCKSIAFCCISTGVFMFPNERASEIAVKTVTEFLDETSSEIKVVFNVFKNIDYLFYKNQLEAL